MNEIKNIAVCLYGRFGTGEYCAPNILKFFKTNHNVNVDFFCATKDYNNYYHTVAECPDDIKRLDINDLTNKLSVYNPKGIAISTLEEDEGRRGQYHPKSTGHLFSQICESIMLKSDYESHNDMQYDVVFVTRYDVLFAPDHFDYLDHYITWHNNEFDNTKLEIFGNGGKSWMFTTSHAGNSTIKVSWNDILFVGSSLAMDLVAANTLLISADQHHTNKKTHIYPDSSGRWGHQGLGYIFRQSNISVANYPCFDKNGNVFGQWNAHTTGGGGIGHTLVREYGEMIHPSTSIEAFNHNMWSWSNDKPISHNPEYITELQQSIDKQERTNGTIT
jgi:hypothetical protein